MAKSEERDKGHWSGLFRGPIDGHDVTVRFGREGTAREGHTLLSDGHPSSSTFDTHTGHNHYDGKGGDTDTGAYTGPGSADSGSADRS